MWNTSIYLCAHRYPTGGYYYCLLANIKLHVYTKNLNPYYKQIKNKMQLTTYHFNWAFFNSTYFWSWHFVSCVSKIWSVVVIFFSQFGKDKSWIHNSGYNRALYPADPLKTCNFKKSDFSKICVNVNILSLDIFFFIFVQILL